MTNLKFLTFFLLLWQQISKIKPNIRHDWNRMLYGWSYRESSPYGPKNWKKVYPECGNTRNFSPLDIRFDDSSFSDHLKPARFEGRWVNQRRLSATLQLKNSLLILDFHPQSEVKLFGLILGSSEQTKANSTYLLDKCFLHWGKSSLERGAEHSADFRETQLELQCQFVTRQQMIDS